MELEASLHTAAPRSAVIAYVAELDKYPQWMALVHSASLVHGTHQPTWEVELRAKVGPFARSKRLRMARTQFVEGEETRIVFERRETDGRQHAAWRLSITVRDNTSTSDARAVTQQAGTHLAGTHLAMHLHYDGRFFVSVVEAILQQNIDAGRKRLSELLGD
jgi:hypothetical protein